MHAYNCTLDPKHGRQITLVTDTVAMLHVLLRVEIAKLRPPFSMPNCACLLAILTPITTEYVVDAFGTSSYL
jgi:hypothetical protein